MKLKPISFLILGMLRLGATSGYAIKKAADAATNSFWSVSLAQVYPELARLEKHGFVARQDDPQGARTRSRYSLTQEGEEALLAWLRSPLEIPPRVRSEGLLRFFFADALPPAEQADLARRAQERLRTERAHMYDKDLRRSLAYFERAGIRMPALLGLFAESALIHNEEWLAQLEAQFRLEAETEGDS
jgi:DNA-binding PadR family transcriptional regulator